jgi:hypothetical protein
MANSASTSPAPGVAETSAALLSMTSMVGAWAVGARSRRITAARIARAATGTRSSTLCDSAAGNGPRSVPRIRAATAQQEVPVVNATRISSPPPTGSYSRRYRGLRARSPSVSCDSVATGSALRANELNLAKSGSSSSLSQNSVH